MIIEKASGKPYGTFLAERIFKPLGMTSTSLDDYADARPMRAKGYSTADGQTKPAEHTHPTQPFAAGALVSTVVDLAKWDAALAGPQAAEAGELRGDVDADALQQRQGVDLRVRLGGRAVSATRPRQAHGGGITGFSTFMARFPDDKVTVIVLVNQSGGAGQARWPTRIAEIYVPGVKDARAQADRRSRPDDDRLPEAGR